MKKYFTKKEIIETIIEHLKDYDGYYGDLHDEVFNADYYIIGTYKAEQALEQYGVFEAIRKIQEYEMDDFGEVYTDFTNPEKVASMLWYILGDEVLWEILDNRYMSGMADDETNAELIERLQEELEEA